MTTPTPYGQVPDVPRPSVPQPPLTPPQPPQQHTPTPQVGTPSHHGYASAYGRPQPSQQQQQQQYGAPTAPTRATPGAKSSGRAMTVVTTSLVTAAVSVTVTLFATGAFTAAPLFEEGALEAGVFDVLTDDFELTDVDDVTCPAEVVAQGGEQFECTFTSGGEDLSVPVEVLTDDGQYRVGGPLAEGEG